MTSVKKTHFKPIPKVITDLSPAELSLIKMANPVVKVAFDYKKNTTRFYSGHIINFKQDITKINLVLPNLVEDC